MTQEPFPYHQLPLSHVWSSDELPKDYDDAASEAERRVLESPGWPEWLTQYVGPGGPEMDGLHILHVEDREKRRFLVRGNDLSMFEPGEAVAQAAKTGTMVDYFISVYAALYQHWAEKKDHPAPPPIR